MNLNFKKITLWLVLWSRVTNMQSILFYDENRKHFSITYKFVFDGHTGNSNTFFFKIILEQNELIYWSFFQICNAIWLTWDAWIFIRQYCFLLMQNYFKWSQIIWEIVGSTLIRKKLMQQYYGSEARNITVHWYMWPWTTKPVISSTGIFVAIAKNTLYGSNFFFYDKNH